MTKVNYEIDLALKEQIKNIPASCGIYMMLGKKGEVMYIGKAVNLKDRVRSYFNVASWNDRPKLYFMIPKVKEIKTVVTNSEKEALILEANLVNQYQPKYNVTLKDDKKFPWLMITYDEEYPRVIPIRDVVGFRKKYPKTKNKFFGPYSDSGAMWDTYKVLKEGFQLRLRRKPLFKDRPCMNYHLKLCSGPCQKLISYNDYHKIVKQVEDFLLGRYDIVIKNLKDEMTKTSKNLEYEKAAKIRDTIQKIERILEKQIVVSDNHTLSQDVFSFDFQDEIMVLELLIIREGKIIAIESLTINIPKGTPQEEAFQEGIKQYYFRAENETIPKEIVTEIELNEKESIQQWLSSRIEVREVRGKVRMRENNLSSQLFRQGTDPPGRAALSSKIKITCPKKGKKFELIQMAKQNARLALQRILVSRIGSVETLQATSLSELQQVLGLKNYPCHIECFDVSHLGGTGTVGSMVCFIDGKPEKSLYRKFNIKSLPLDKIDDFAAIKEIVIRRYKRQDVIARRDGIPTKQSSDMNRNEIASSHTLLAMTLPDLIIIDGGKGQLNAAKEVLKSIDVDLQKIDLISIAKKQEEIFVLEKKDPVLLDRNSQALFLIQRIRDEAHRFAITFQREKRAKDVFKDQ